MPRHCESCRFYTPDDSVKECPQCHGPVKFTLLPPANATPDNHSLGDARSIRDEVLARSRNPVGFTDLFRGGNLPIVVLGAGAIVAAVVFLVIWRGEPFEQRVAKLKVGMPMLDAMLIMGDDNKPREKKTVFRFGSDGSNERFSEFNEPVDTSGEGMVVYEMGSDAVEIYYSRGVVTKFQTKQTEGGLRVKIRRRR